MEKVNDKIRKFRFLQNKFEKKNCARCAFFEKFFTEKLFFFFASDFLSLDGGKGGDSRGALCILISNVCEREKNKTRAAFELGNTVVGVRPNLRHM